MNSDLYDSWRVLRSMYFIDNFMVKKFESFIYKGQTSFD